MTSLSDKQQSFVLNYLKNGFNMRCAAREAGYSEAFVAHKAHTLIENPEIYNRVVVAYKQYEMKQMKEIMITIEERVKILQSIIYDIVPKNGDEPKRNLYKVALQAVSELNKMAGDYAPDKRLSVTVDATQGKLKDARKQYDEF